jgi:predicted phosphodiesterase
LRYAIVSDIHGNFDALEAVISSIRDHAVDHTVCLGDVVGYGPQPLECIQALQRIHATIVAGNHDFAIAEKIDISTFNVYARESTLWTRDVLDSESLAFLAQLPLVEELEGFTVVHGTLHSPELFDYIQSCYEASLSLAAMDQAACFIGHSHVPVAFVQNEFISYCTNTTIPIDPNARTIINVGSVGQPRDQDPRACYAVYDTDDQEVNLHRVHYDIESTISKIDAVGLPRPLGERLRVGR